MRRLQKIPRYTSCNTKLLGGIELTDSLSFVAGYQEIFIRENYKFSLTGKEPFIIDCGANIGLSIIYFKKNYPHARIIGYEPDIKIFSVLKKNVEKLGLDRITLHNKAVGKQKAIMNFDSEGGFSGRLTDRLTPAGIPVEIEMLSTVMDGKIDFLKIDIEGTELDVLTEIRPKLNLVEKMFIEYHSFPDKPQCLDHILTLLKEEGFRTHIKEAYAAPHPFIEIPLVAGMDNQLEIYAYR